MTLLAVRWACWAFQGPAPTSEPSATSAPADAAPISPLLLGLLCVGLLVLLVWIIRRVLHPTKLRLDDSPGRPNRLHAIHVLAVFAAWLAAAGFIFEHYPFPQRIGALAVGQVGWLAVGLVVSAATFQGGLRRGLGLSLRHWSFDAARAVIGYLAVLPICIGLLVAARAVLPEDWMHIHALLQQLPRLSLGWRLALVVSAVVLAPLSEEVFYRGLLQTALRRVAPTPWVAIVIASILFTLTHLPNVQDLPALLVLSLVLGYNYERTGRLVAPILIHAMFNAVFIAEMWLQVS